VDRSAIQRSDRGAISDYMTVISRTMLIAGLSDRELPAGPTSGQESPEFLSGTEKETGKGQS